MNFIKFVPKLICKKVNLIIKTMKKLFTLVLACILAFASFAQEPGEIDTNFGTNGIFVFHPSEVDAFGYFDYVYKVLVQEDGKIITIGESRTDKFNYAIYISRHNVDGTLDETYGKGGFVFLKVSELIYKNCPYDAVLGEDGMLYLAGYAYNGLNAGFILCLDENGFENENFGEGGWAITEQEQNGFVYEAIDIDSKGRCVVAGYYQDEIIVRRYNAKGKLDKTFGEEGTSYIELDSDPNTHSYAYDVKILDNGKIILCGDKRAAGEDGMFIWSYMMRLKSNGSVDESFGENGVVYLWTGEYAEFALSIDVQPNGKYIVGGHDELWSDTPELPRYESFVTRVNKDGTIDETFGENGYVKVEPIQGDGCVNYSYSILVASDGQIFGTVYSRNINTEVYRAYIYNLDEDGRFNEDFAGAGVVPLPKIYEEQNEINTYSIALQGKDKLVVAGYAAYDDPAVAGPGDYTKIYLARINVDVKELMVDATAVDENTVVVAVIPTQNVVEYHVDLYTKEAHSLLTEGELLEKLQADGKPYKELQEFTYDDLAPKTEYVAVVAYKDNTNAWSVKESYVATPSGVGFEEMQNVKFNVYPNPATSVIFVETASNENAQVSIVDLTGRCVKEVEVSNVVSVINIEDIESGVYFINIKQNDNNYVEKLVVK